jgi:hypothetical protein
LAYKEMIAMSNTLANKDIEDLARRIAELTGGGNITQRCVSLTEGALSPDLRVNYEFGLVLGVDEFRQEQLYHLEQSYQHNRALHGYGTVYGLRVTTARPGADTDEVEITVEPGMAIDQWGRAVIVRDTQCARLGAWLAKHTPPSQGPSGELSVYVVLRYDECPDVLQPIPGQPCSGSDTAQAASRIRDSFHIELRWEPPQMQAWRAVQRFARLLAAVQLEPDLPPDLAHSDEAVIIEQVRLLDQAGESLFDPGGAGVSGLDLHPARDFLVLPAAGARDALDRILIVWATEVRPRLRPDLSDPAGGGAPNDPAVLLARIDFVGSSPYIDDPSLPSAADNTVRPFLLHTQLIQELLLLGGAGEAQHEFATLQAYGSRVLHAWVHYPGALDITPAALQLTADGRRLRIAEVRQLGTPNLFEIVYDPTPIVDPFPLDPNRNRITTRLDAAEPTGERGLVRRAGPSDRLGLTFLLDRINVREDERFLPALDRLGAGYIGYDRQANTIAVYTIAAPAAEEFATLQARGGGVLHAAIQYPALLAMPDRTALTLRSDGQELPIIAIERLSSSANRFKIIVGHEPDDLSRPGERRGLIAERARVELSFQLDQLKLGDGTALLPDMDRRGLAYEGRDGDIISVETLAGPIAASRELVSFSINVPRDGRTQLILWFHPNTTGAVSLPTGPDQKPAFKAWRVDSNQAIEFRAEPIDPAMIRGQQFATQWRLMVMGDVADLQQDERLAFSFFTERIRVAPNNITLAEQIRQYRLAFTGYNGNDRIRAFYRVELPVIQHGPGGLTEEQVRVLIRDALLLQPALPFLTVTPFAGSAAQPPQLELWFHLDQRPQVDELRLAEPDFELFMEIDGQIAIGGQTFSSPVPLKFSLVGKPQHNVFQYRLDPVEWRQLREAQRPPRFCRLVFSIDRNKLTDEAGSNRGTLSEYINAQGIKFEGHNGKDTIVHYVRIPDATVQPPNG